MKKHLFSSFALTLLMAFLAPFTLSSCSEEVVEDRQEPQQEENLDIPEGVTEFSSADDAATRTSIGTPFGNKVNFYWAEGDKIWVDTLGDGSFTAESQNSVLAADKRTAKFYFTGDAMKNETYNLTYTGINSTSGRQVTIPAEQAQTEPNDSTHIGRSGDCATAVAEKQSNGKYSFKLKHKAHYLILRPYKDDVIQDRWKLTGIEIIELDGKPLSGTFRFGMNGLVASPVQNAKDTIKITLGGTDGWVLPKKGAEDDTLSWYAVIAPTPDGSQHRLRIKYKIKPTEDVEINYYKDSDPSDDPDFWNVSTFTIVKDVLINSAPNKVTTIRHKMTVESYPTSVFYMWDAPIGEHYWVNATSTPPTFYGGSGTGYPTSSTDSRYTTYVVPTADNIQYDATNSCKDLPNVNAATWYVMAGDPRWETEYPWCIDGDYKHIYTCGTWFLMWDHIVAANPSHLPAGTKYTDCAVSFVGTNIPIYNNDKEITGYRDYDGTDYRSKRFTNERNEIDNNWFQSRVLSYRFGGRPAKLEIGKYFFLPANGHLDNGNLANGGGIHGCYWLSSAVPKKENNVANSKAYIMEMKHFALQVRQDNGRVIQGRPAVPNWWK